jgi:hypothetical protein
VLSSGIILLFLSSIILWYLECKKYNNKIENRLCGDGCVEKDTLSKSYKTDKPIEPTESTEPTEPDKFEEPI